MTFVSYAQNFEDVILRRVLRHVNCGFYIDVGAYSPDVDSVTRAFYEDGWRGINIEPNPADLRQFPRRRPHDVNIGFAAGEFDGDVTLNTIEHSGLTTVDTSIAERHSREGWEINAISVPARRLSWIWDEYVPANQPVHFLKIDVEGHEEAVLRGCDWVRHRPWIIVVEATLPLSQVETHMAWEPTLKQADYTFAYADGLNRFYCASEHADLMPSFKYPPNVFDGFIQEKQARLTGELDRLSTRLASLTEQNTGLAEQSRKLVSQLSTCGAALATEREQTQQLQLRASALEARNNYLENRTVFERLLFRASGKPKSAVRRLLFHNSGKPRGVFRRWVLRKDGRPHWPFRPWMESESYLRLPRAIKLPRREKLPPLALLSPRARYFLKRLEAARSRG